MWSNPCGAGRNGAIRALPRRADTTRYLPACAPTAQPRCGSSIWQIFAGQHTSRLACPRRQAALVLSGIMLPARREWLESRGCLVFQEPADAVDAVAVLARAAAQSASR